MARNKVNLKMQMLQKLDAQAAYGIKKVKEVPGCDKNYNSNRNVNGIASYKSMEKYKSCCSTFCDWIKTSHPDVKSIDAVTTDIVKEYVEHRAETCSNYTISADVSALNRACHSDPQDRNFWKLSDFGDYRRHKDEIVNNRGIKTDYHTAHYERNQSAILMASAFGIRRQSVENATCDQFIYKDGQIYSIEVYEKGGKYRECVILPEYAQQVTVYIANKISQEGENCNICQKPDHNVNLHAYRSQYAVSLFNSYRENPDYYQEWRERYIDEKALETACSHPRYNQEYTRGYHTETLGIVSQALG